MIDFLVYFSASFAASISVVAVFFSINFFQKKRRQSIRTQNALLNFYRTVLDQNIALKRSRDSQLPIKISRILENAVLSLNIIIDSEVSASFCLFRGNSDTELYLDELITTGNTTGKPISEKGMLLGKDTAFHRVLTTQKVLLIDSLENAVESKYSIAGKRPEFMGSLLVVPIKASFQRGLAGSTIGALAFSSKKTHVFGGAPMQFAKNVARLIESVMEQVFFEESETKAPSIS